LFFIVFFKLFFQITFSMAAATGFIPVLTKVFSDILFIQLIIQYNQVPAAILRQQRNQEYVY
jgi:hypothetical protein